MRTLLVLLVGIAVGAIGTYLYFQSPNSATAPASATAGTAKERADRAVAQTRAAASEFADAFSQKMQDWHLTPDDIRADLAKSGQVVRDNTARFRDKVSDARIVTVIKAKYVLEKDLSANAVSVESADGRVVLSGTLPSEALIAKAVTLAMDTDGVRGVTSKITVAAK